MVGAAIGKADTPRMGRAYACGIRRAQEDMLFKLIFQVN